MGLVITKKPEYTDFKPEWANNPDVLNSEILANFAGNCSNTEDVQSSNKIIPFYCPVCNCDTRELLNEVIMATPYDAGIKCCGCNQYWRINLYPVENNQTSENS